MKLLMGDIDHIQIGQKPLPIKVQTKPIRFALVSTLNLLH